MKRPDRTKPRESIADFKARIAGMMRAGGELDTIPLRKTPSNIVRLPTDRGYFPPSQERPQ